MQTAGGPDRGGGVVSPYQPSGDSYAANGGGGGGGDASSRGIMSSATALRGESFISSGIMSGAIVETAKTASNAQGAEATPSVSTRDVVVGLETREGDSEAASSIEHSGDAQIEEIADPGFTLMPNSIRLFFETPVSIKVADVIKALERRGGDELLKKVCGVLHTGNMFRVLFDSPVPSLVGKALEACGTSSIIQDGNVKPTLESLQATSAKQWMTTITFRIAGLPLSVQPVELLKQLNKLGFKLSSIANLAQVFHADPYCQKWKIRSEIVEVRQDCLKAEADSFTKLCGTHLVMLSGLKFKIRLFRPGHCFTCNQRGHIARECPVAADARKVRAEQLVCWFCKQPGHSRSHCKANLEKRAEFESQRALRTKPFDEPDKPREDEILPADTHQFPHLIAESSPARAVSLSTFSSLLSATAPSAASSASASAGFSVVAMVHHAPIKPNGANLLNTPQSSNKRNSATITPPGQDESNVAKAGLSKKPNTAKGQKIKSNVDVSVVSENSLGDNMDS